MDAGDAFGPNPGNKNPAGPNPFCVASQNPFVACDSKGECGKLTVQPSRCKRISLQRLIRFPVMAGHMRGTSKHACTAMRR